MLLEAKLVNKLRLRSSEVPVFLKLNLDLATPWARSFIQHPLHQVTLPHLREVYHPANYTGIKRASGMEQLFQGRECTRVI